MSKKITVKNMPGKNRPQLTCDTHGYPSEVEDKEWATKHRKLWIDNGDGTWTKK